jgi:hypothetical protein
VLAVEQALTVPAVVVPVVVQVILALRAQAALAVMVEFTAEAVVQLGIIMQPVAVVLEAQSVSFGPEQLVASHQQIQETYNA